MAEPLNDILNRFTVLIRYLRHVRKDVADVVIAKPLGQVVHAGQHRAVHPSLEWLITNERSILSTKEMHVCQEQQFLHTQWVNLPIGCNADFTGRLK